MPAGPLLCATAGPPKSRTRRKPLNEEVERRFDLLETSGADINGTNVIARTVQNNLRVDVSDERVSFGIRPLGIHTKLESALEAQVGKQPTQRDTLVRGCDHF